MRNTLILEDPSKYGIRDPHLLGDHAPIKVDGNFLLYYNSRRKTGKTKTDINVATSTDFINWLIRGCVLEDGDYTAIGSVVKLGDQYVIYYSPNVQKGFRYQISNDPFTWSVKQEEYFLSPECFKNVKYMGLPYVTEIDKFYCLFEGMSNSGFKIYMATSIDGLNWQASNDGESIYEQEHEFEVRGQANPSLYRMHDKYYLFYNGFDGTGWSINYATSKNASFGYKSGPTPILSYGSKKQIRIEGARIIRKNSGYKMIYFMCPTGDSYRDSKIYMDDLTI